MMICLRTVPSSTVLIVCASTGPSMATASNRPVRTILRACLKTRFGVPPLGGAAQKPPKGGTPNLLQQVSMVFFKQALRELPATAFRRWVDGLGSVFGVVGFMAIAFVCVSSTFYSKLLNCGIIWLIFNYSHTLSPKSGITRLRGRTSHRLPQVPRRGCWWPRCSTDRGGRRRTAIHRGS